MPTCATCQTEFTLPANYSAFLEKVSPVFNGQKELIPLPTDCLDCRHQRRFAHRNERRIYNSTCAKTGEAIISMYSNNNPYIAYKTEAWYSDDWDAKQYGRDFDFSRPFFEQFAELRLQVPRISLIQLNCENSEFCNLTASNKNCYLVFGGDYNEDSAYSIFCFYSQDVYDTYWVGKSELVYDSIDCHNCYNIKYCQNTHNSQDSYFLFECRNCRNCFGCVNLNNKEYHIFNKPHSKAEYEAKLAAYQLNTSTGVQHFKKEFEKFRLQFPHRASEMVNTENSSGNHLVGANNCHNCYDLGDGNEDCQDFILGGYGAKDIFSSSHAGHKIELLYEVLGSPQTNNTTFTLYPWYSNNCHYCDSIMNSQNLFGCSNMVRAEYCILNKQYTKEEYETLVPKIIAHMRQTGEWGKFFPMEISTFAYNETVANDYYPLTESEIKAKGLKYEPEIKKRPNSEQIIPNSIKETTDDILRRTLVCQETGRPYRINQAELEYYRKLDIPIPHLAPETRNEKRLAKRTPWQVWEHHCAKCQKALKTSYAPDRPEIIYCEDCHRELLY